ncbi:CoA transferase [Tepidimonas taiwanensis]|uniref:Succinyl-CoA--L-malate CoA-transferase beta subunit n=1 Tax=Tepidimonas taiwanensis TaxID=307486 RepID=A0A554X5Q1_9BURK|nr:CoA transferase [Tepidimonas taiwanensis]MCX7693883.1 CoA transferase [Tepidimonas taiwanensis]MDM7463867.1 CoA transferase [Tepidimonas taiwanensis]TSE31096.1 Succinyl-CoA--L-malate CoA-transferase beta subunit [Tepidimonas taiwanensis]UBQ05245.1 CoA transferase [Tepidimonas taiwanensis]
MTARPDSSPGTTRPLAGVHVVTLALNLPGPAAVMRLRALGARCTKVDPPSGDPMRGYCPAAYGQLHRGVRTVAIDLKTPAGQRRLQRLLAHADVLLTSFRPSALAKLGLDAATVQARWPRLSLVRIVGAAGARAEEAGHDLTYQAEAGLVDGVALPPSLLADMAGALLAVEAVLLVLRQREQTGRGVVRDVALADGAAWLALPRTWGLTAPGALLGGAHAGYRVYACADGRVAVAALEPHFARRLGEVTGLGALTPEACLQPATAAALAAWFATRSRATLDALARTHDLPWVTLAPGSEPRADRG